MNVVSSEMFSKGKRSTIERSSSEPEETNMLRVLVQLTQPQTQQQQQQEGTLNDGSHIKASTVSLNVGLTDTIEVGSKQQGNAIAIKCGSVNSGRLSQFWAISSEPGEPEYDSIAAKRTAPSLTWLVATAAPHHATGNRALLSGYTPERDDLFVHATGGGGGGAAAPMRVLGRGAVVTDAVKFPDVWYVPGLSANLVSVGQLAELGYSVASGRGTCRVRSGNGGGAGVVGEARAGERGVFELDFLRVPLGM